MDVTFKIVYGHAIKVFYLTMVAKQSNPDLFNGSKALGDVVGY